MAGGKPMTEAQKCPQCGKVITAAVSRRIVDRAWDPARQKQYVRTQTMEFCSQDCGGYYQMGCEG